MRTVITGAASGIGQAVVDLLLEDPDAHLLLVDLNSEGLARIAAQHGPRVSTLQADLSAPDCGKHVVTAAIERLGGIDGLVSNAGLLPRGPLVDATLADFDLSFALNVRATWLLAQAAYPHLRESGGSLVATASMAASDPTPGCSFYAPSKAALLMVVRQLANEWGPDNIRCNCVSPGPTLTGMNNDTFADPEKRRARESTIPLRRMSMPHDIARAIVFLLGDSASQISGANLPVDGGLTTTLMSAGMVQRA
ncbi:SDR family NAD(P)-dependent oxidoreductase [Novosphingobium sp. BL-52-GroH]|uniref:SDR family NAD(P)-dependent oxidoreductase n=1 Tax=Novosphingobium sp. BL-52-GroH TaxID=3349877 RepID=UPI00384BE50A